MAPPRFPAIIVGRVGEGQLLNGWHERERDGRNGIAYRAARRDGILELRRDPGAREISLLMSGPVILYGGKMNGRLLINRQKHELPLSVDSWVLRSYPIESEEDVLRIHLFIPEPAIPDQVLQNGDARELGWFLSAIWQE